LNRGSFSLRDPLTSLRIKQSCALKCSGIHNLTYSTLWHFRDSVPLYDSSECNL
jgi:hypothetical protein